MTDRIKLIIASLLAAVLLPLVVIPISTQQGRGTYDPWLDYDENGVIDVNDLHPLGDAYGTTGDSTKNVNVTNWPDSSTRRELFPRNLVLRGTYASSSSYFARWLIDSETLYANPNIKDWSVCGRKDFEAWSILANGTEQLFWNQTFTYAQIQTVGYQILGMPTVSLTFNVSYEGILSWMRIKFHVTLGAYSTDGLWRQLYDLGNYYKWFNAPPQNLYDLQMGCWFFNYPVFSPVTVNAYERIAVRIEITAQTGGEELGVWLTQLYHLDTDEFLVNIPITENS